MRVKEFSTKLLIEAKKKIPRCPNCGAVIIFGIEMPSFKNAKQINNKEEYDSTKPYLKGKKLYNCGNCGFVWVDSYDHVEFDWSSKNNKFTK